MDNLGYVYYPGTNKLRQVTDSRPANDFGKTGVTASYFDIDNQAASNYVYDSIGNLIKDNAEGITAITWNVYGKMTGITKASGSFTYTYDPQGNRASAYNSATGKTTCYVRDAQGNVLSTYENTSTTLKLKEVHLYGSSRLGIHNYDLTVTSMTGEPTKAVGIVVGIKRSFTRGNKFFELTNHLGNVLVTISDQKTSTANGVWVAKYQPLTINAQDYYSFGMPQPFSEYNASISRYRYGFNGKENDNDVKGNGSQQDYGMRIYDPRLGRFLSVDPIAKKYPELTPYQFASNTPIAAIDMDGLEGLAGPPMGSIYAANKPLYDDLIAGRNTPRVQNAQKIGGVIVLAGALALDAFVTKGWATRTLMASQVFGAMEHNRATTPEGQYKQEMRSKELLTDAAFSWMGGKLTGMTWGTTTELLGMARSRLSLALRYYRRVGANERDVSGIDLTKAVSEVDLNSSRKLYQWTIEGKLGDYYTTSPNSKQLGVPQLADGTPAYFDEATNALKARTLVEITLPKGVALKGLKSTASFTPAWDGASGINKGGDPQIFSPEVKLKNPTVNPIK